jgi:hypothetical protein
VEAWAVQALQPVGGLVGLDVGGGIVGFVIGDSIVKELLTGDGVGQGEGGRGGSVGNIMFSLVFCKRHSQNVVTSLEVSSFNNDGTPFRSLALLAAVQGVAAASKLLAPFPENCSKQEASTATTVIG